MKKIMLFLLATIMILAFTSSCAKKEDASWLVGTWGMYQLIVLEGDVTYTRDPYDHSFQLVFEPDGKMYYYKKPENKFKYSIKNGTLILGNAVAVTISKTGSDSFVLKYSGGGVESPYNEYYRKVKVE